MSSHKKENQKEKIIDMPGQLVWGFFPDGGLKTIQRVVYLNPDHLPILELDEQETSKLTHNEI